MRKYEITLFDNTNDENRRAEVMECLRADNIDSETPIPITEELIQQEIDDLNTDDWRYLMLKLDEMFDGSIFLLTGYCGRWNGKKECGKFIKSRIDLLERISHLDYLTIKDENGHLVIDGYHHDGNDHYELKKLTSKGYEFADRNYFANTKELHETIFKNNFYSRLPRLARI